MGFLGWGAIMAKQRQYTSILDEITAIFEKEGHKVYKGAFDDQKIFFGIPGIPGMDTSIQRFTGLKTQDQVDTKNTQNIEGQPTNLPKRLNIRPVGDTNNSQRQVSLPASSTIQSAAFWPTKQYLLVSFKSGHTYSYQNVPAMTIGMWEFAVSAGSFFYYNIRMSYPYQKMG